VLPVGSYIIATEVLPADLASSVLPTGRMVFDTRNFLAYWRLTPDGRLAYGGRRDLDPADVVDARDFLYDQMVAVHPQLAGVRITHAWGGNVAMTLDRLPHVGRIDGAWYATGCNGSGVALNTWLGHRLAQAVCGDAPLPACSELRHRPIPWSSARSAYLPWVGRYLSLQDAR
jgi:glycine/D-amino acid oxidase-like deaminating enzyme